VSFVKCALCFDGKYYFAISLIALFQKKVEALAKKMRNVFPGSKTIFINFVQTTRHYHVCNDFEPSLPTPPGAKKGFSAARSLQNFALGLLTASC